MVRPGCRSESNSNPEGGLHPPLPAPAQLVKNSHSHKLLWQSSQKPQTVRGITSAYGQKCHRISSQTDLTRLFQPTISSPKTRQQVEAHFGPKQSESFPQDRKIQDGDTGNHQDITPTGRVGSLHRLQGRLLPHSNTGTVQEILEISYPWPDLPAQSTTVRSVHSAHGVHYHIKGGKADGRSKGYKDPPIPRRLVGENHIPPGLSPTCTGPSTNVPRVRLAGEHRKVGAGTKANFQLCRLPVRPTPDRWQSLQEKILELLSLPACSVREFMSLIGLLTATEKQVHLGRLHMKPIQWHLKSNWRIPESLEKVIPLPRSSSLAMVAQRRQCPHRPTITRHATRSANLYRRIKRRVGLSLKRVHCQRNLVPARKQTTHKLPGAKSSLSGLTRVPRPICGQIGSNSNRQHHGSVLHQQGKRHEVGPTVCPTLENLDLVHRETSDSKGPTHSRPLKCSGRQTIQIRPDHPNRMVPPSRGFSNPVQQVAPASNRSLCHEIQQQIAPVCITSSGSHGHCSGCTQLVMGESGRVCLPTDSHIGQSGGEVAGLPIPKVDHHCPGVAQHDMVSGPSGDVQSDPIALAPAAKPPDSTLQSDPSQKSDKLKSPCMSPRATAIKEQGFSEAVATRIEAPQRGSTRSIYEAKWAIFTKWCITNQVDFRATPVKSVADFLMYLFEDRKLQRVFTGAGHVTLQISTQLPASRSPSVTGLADKK